MRSEALSVDGLVLRLASGAAAAPVSVDTQIVPGSLCPEWGGERVPIVSFRDAGSIQVYLDEKHPLFVDLGIRPEVVVAFEMAQYEYELNAHLLGNKSHTLPTLAEQVLRERWQESLAETPEAVRASVQELFDSISASLHGSDRADDFYGELEEQEQLQLVQGIIAAGLSLTELERIRSSGDYLAYVGPSSLTAYFRRYPDAWFGRVWSDTLPGDELGGVVARGVRDELVTYLRCLEDCASFLRYQHPERLLVIRTRASLDFLQAKLR